jgi:uncharacterized protein
MRPNVRLVITAIVVGLLVIGVFAVGIRILFPPKDTRFEGIPTIYPYVNDLAGALSLGYSTWIDDICYEIDVRSSCEVAVLVVNTTQPNDISYFALRVFQKNQIGVEGKDNGVLIVVAVSDRKWKVEVGYGLMGILTGARVANLADAYLVPNIENGTLEDGLVDFTSEMGSILITEYTGAETSRPAYPIAWIPLQSWQWVVIIVVIVVLSVVTRGRIILPVLWVIELISGGRGKFGGGRSGGGGARGRY